ncbi:MAG: HAD hydrolase-like protein [Candidatus Hydrogenedentes bacterium]|nr:HAD hydrolase-like protein [Candidatus Hydrogenedentota bacterium]
MNRRGTIIFDVDGTLFQAGLVTAPAIQKSFRENGLVPPCVETISTWYGKPVEAYHAWLASLCPPDLVRRIIADTDRYELEFIASDGKLYPGVPEVLNTLRAQGFFLATSSNAPQDYFDTVVDTQGLRPYIDLPLCRGTQFRDKTEIVAAILDRVPVRPVIVIGDRSDDVDSAHAHGAFAVASLYGFGSREELRDADAFVQEVIEIPSAIERLVSSRARQ